MSYIRTYFLKESSGDLEESRTPIDGMKTRCTNRYTTRPCIYYSKNLKNYKSK